MSRPRCAPIVLAIAVLALIATPVSAAESYHAAPAPLGDIVDAPPTPSFELSPDRMHAMIVEYPSLPPIAELAEPELRIAGLRIKPATNGPSRIRYISGLRVRDISGKNEKAITGLPSDARLAWADWSPDSSHIAFTITTGGPFELWVADVASGKARRLGGDIQLNAASWRPYAWMPDSRSIVALTLPADRGTPPAEPSVPQGPTVQQNLGKTAPARTYQDLLQNAYDETLFEYYLTAQLVRLPLDGKPSVLGTSGLIGSFDPAPNGKYLLVETIHRPFSYLVPAYRFPNRVEIWNVDGKVVKQIADLPLQEEVPTAFDSVPDGPRSFGWRADAPATLHWVEARDGGDSRTEAEVRDELLVLDAPFEGNPRSLAKLGMRYRGVQWAHDDLAIVYDSWWKTRRERAWVLQPSKADAQPTVLWERSREDRYGDPGRPVTHANAAGRAVLTTVDGGDTILLIGEGASPEGNRPFLDKMDVTTGETARLFRSEAPFYERPVTVLGEKLDTILTRRESVEEQPNYYSRELKSGKLQQLTRFPHPNPQLAGLSKELIQYKRDDGVELSGTLYLPPGYEPSQGRLPMLLWAYPREFKSADAAGQVRDSPYQFDRVSWASPLLFLTQGYAVLDDPAMPIIGEGGEEPNDTYVDQLVSSARAAINEVVRRGIADRDRIAIGGHSYGAFMTANLLAHSDLFRAGIARSGAYNRTLTPFGFQAEERTFWEAPEIYFEMSPFMHADQVNEPILLVHGEADNNSGTFPMQSERFYAALKGHGATARLVMLPHESHGYRAKESIHHMLWEMTTWLDTHVKNAPPREEVPATAASAASGE